MSLKSEHLISLIFKKLKNYKAKKIFLEEHNLNEFISSLLKELKWIQREFDVNCYNYWDIWDVSMYNFSTLTILLIIIFVLSLYFLFKITANPKN